MAQVRTLKPDCLAGDGGGGAPGGAWGRCAGPHVEAEDAEVEDAAQALAVGLAEAVQVGALPGRAGRQRVARARARDALPGQRAVRGVQRRQRGQRLRAGAARARRRIVHLVQLMQPRGRDGGSAGAGV